MLLTIDWSFSRADASTSFYGAVMRKASADNERTVRQRRTDKTFINFQNI
jgi:hypothetical protein